MTQESLSDPIVDDVPEYYADSLNMTLGGYGFGLEFGVIPFPDFGAGTAQPAPPTPARPVVRLRVSPQMAKAIKNLLINNVGVYESIFGEIRIPDEGVDTDSNTEADEDQA
jgi:hypothetical protein